MKIHLLNVKAEMERLLTRSPGLLESADAVERKEKPASGRRVGSVILFRLLVLGTSAKIENGVPKVSNIVISFFAIKTAHIHL